MDSFSAFAMGEANRDKPRMVFDWIKAAKLIVEMDADMASAGLRGDWEWTGGTIFNHGKPVSPDDTYVFLASTWATPELDIDGEIIDCYVMEKDANGWDAGTYWPQEALDILAKGKGE